MVVLDIAASLPDPAALVTPIVGPIFSEIFTKFIPFAGSVLVGAYAIKRMSGGK